MKTNVAFGAESVLAKSIEARSGKLRENELRRSCSASSRARNHLAIIGDVSWPKQQLMISGMLRAIAKKASRCA